MVEHDLTLPCIEHAQGGRYGRVWHRGRLRAQHVQSWELANEREVPAGWHVDHLCFNVRCIRPQHLEAVPAIENVRRQRNVKLTLALAEEIRREYAALPRATRRLSDDKRRTTDRPVKVAKGARLALAVKYGISVTQVRDIVNGRRWVA